MNANSTTQLLTANIEVTCGHHVTYVGEQIAVGHVIPCPYCKKDTVVKAISVCNAMHVYDRCVASRDIEMKCDRKHEEIMQSLIGKWCCRDWRGVSDAANELRVLEAKSEATSASLDRAYMDGKKEGRAEMCNSLGIAPTQGNGA